jgi:SAM-dependent methyltransferase
VDPTVRLIEDLRDVALGRLPRVDGVVPRPDRGELLRNLEAAVVNADVDALPSPPGRGAGLKRTLLKLNQFSWSRQRAVNRGLLGALSALADEVSYVYQLLEDERRRTAGALAGQQLEIERVGTRMEALQAQVRSEAETTVKAMLDDTTTLVDDLRADLVHERVARQALQREFAMLGRDLARIVGGEAFDAQRADELSSGYANELGAIYQRFEDAFREAGEDLSKRFEVYLSDLDHLRGGSLEVIDIGAGRGDWLRLLQTNRIPGRGVDSNLTAVKEANEAGLEVVAADGLEHLRRLEPESVGAVTAFHVVEHLDQSTLVDLVDAALRVLAPGGVLIFETPNPSNLRVGASAFYRDPTHERPVNPDYLAFLVGDRGFVNVETRFLHPAGEYELGVTVPDGPGTAALRSMLDDLRWSLYGPQDYAVIARRPPSA